MAEDNREGQKQEKTEKVQIRCTPETLARWQRIQAAIDPVGTQEDSLNRIMDVYDSNPSRFERDYR